MMKYLAPLLPYATLLTVIVAVVFGLITARHGRRLRYLTAATQLVHMTQTPEFSQGVQRVLELPAKVPAGTIMSDPELVSAAYVVGHAFESLGVMVFYRLLPLQLVDHLIGGYARASWQRLQPYVEARRERLGPMFGEWFQWLAERLEESPAPGKDVGAALAHRAWRVGRFGAHP
ncbi:MAG: hypothetical protein QM778_31060 [Myxococcales bacterium]